MNDNILNDINRMLAPEPTAAEAHKIRFIYRKDGQPIKTRLAMKYPLLSRRERRQMARERRA